MTLWHCPELCTVNDKNEHGRAMRWYGSFHFQEGLIYQEAIDAGWNNLRNTKEGSNCVTGEAWAWGRAQIRNLVHLARISALFGPHHPSGGVGGSGCSNSSCTGAITRTASTTSNTNTSTGMATTKCLRRYDEWRVPGTSNMHKIQSYTCNHVHYIYTNVYIDELWINKSYIICMLPQTCLPYWWALSLKWKMWWLLSWKANSFFGMDAADGYT